MEDFLEQVSKPKYTKKQMAYQNISDDALINSELKLGKWRDFFINSTKAIYLISVLSEIKSS